VLGDAEMTRFACLLLLGSCDVATVAATVHGREIERRDVEMMARQSGRSMCSALSDLITNELLFHDWCAMHASEASCRRGDRPAVLTLVVREEEAQRPTASEIESSAKDSEYLAAELTGVYHLAHALAQDRAAMRRLHLRVRRLWRESSVTVLIDCPSTALPDLH